MVPAPLALPVEAPPTLSAVSVGNLSADSGTPTGFGTPLAGAPAANVEVLAASSDSADPFGAIGPAAGADLPLPELHQRMLDAEMLSDALACAQHMESAEQLAEKLAEKKAAILDDRLEDAIALRDIIKRLENAVRGANEVCRWQDAVRSAAGTAAGRRASFSAGLPEGTLTIAEMHADLLQAGNPEAASAFSARFAARPLGELAREDLNAALLLQATARRCHQVFMSLRSTHRAFPGYWADVLRKGTEEVRSVVAVFAQVKAATANDPDIAQQVVASERAQNCVKGKLRRPSRATCYHRIHPKVGDGGSRGVGWSATFANAAAAAATAGSLQKSSHCTALTTPLATLLAHPARTFCAQASARLSACATALWPRQQTASSSWTAR